MYIDFDDTIIVNNKINLDAIQLIYKCINENVRIFLITKHNGDICNTLKTYNISLDLFDDIIHLNKSEEKTDFISLSNSIFVDDSFSERTKVNKKLNIPTFSVENIKLLL
jgi:hypothetical protein